MFQQRSESLWLTTCTPLYLRIVDQYRWFIKVETLARYYKYFIFKGNRFLCNYILYIVVYLCFIVNFNFCGRRGTRTPSLRERADLQSARLPITGYPPNYKSWNSCKSHEACYRYTKESNQIFFMEIPTLILQIIINCIGARFLYDCLQHSFTDGTMAWKPPAREK